MKRLILLLGTVFLVSLAGWAQDTATIVGTVTDTSGAVIPAARVTVANFDKGFRRDLVANSAGEYVAAKIPIGAYEVTGEAPGFQKLVSRGITLQVGQIQRVDLQMHVGQVSQEVTVTGNVPHVETETGALSGVVTGKQIADLELNGRNFTTLYTLVPGAVQDNSYDSTQVGITGFASISFNGNRMEYNNIEVDGGNNVDEGSGAVSINTFPSIDSIAEFRISTSNFGADMGKHAGAAIEVATKSGTRSFHGEAFEFLRNDKLDSNDWFVNQTPWSSLDPAVSCNGNAAGPCNAPKTPLKRNEFGYNLGGPFYIPGHYNSDRSKTFFFWSESWRRYRDGTVVGPAGVPTVRMRQGDFSECDPASGNYNPVVASNCTLPVDPTTGQTFAGDLVPVGADGQALLNALVPLPNHGVGTYLATPTQPTNWREEQIRVDQNISNKVSAFLRFTNDAWNTTLPNGWAGSSFDSIKNFFGGPAKSAVFHLTYSFKPTLMNEFIMGYTDDRIHLVDEPGSSSVAGSILKPSTWTMKTLFAPNETNPLLPAISLGGGTPFYIYEDAGNLPWFNSSPAFTWKDNVAYTVGRHTLRFGMYLEKYQKNEQFGTDTQGILSFSGSAPISTGNALADMFLGRIAQYTEGTTTVNGVPVGGYAKGHWRSTDLEPYLQDDWKVNRRLTLNIGARYYFFVPVHDVTRPQTVDSGFFPDLYNPDNEAQLDGSGNLITDPNSPWVQAGYAHTYQTFGNGLVECGSPAAVRGCRLPYYWTLAPRFGFAYDPTGGGKTAIRGGYGVYYEPGNGNESNTEGGEGDPPVSLSPSGFNIVGFESIGPGAIGPSNYVATPYREKWGQIQQYSFSVQRQFTNNDFLSVAYVGTLGRHLARNRQLNQVPVGVATKNAPSLAGLTGTVGPYTDPSGNILAPGDLGQQLCDAQGNCDVQTTLIYNEQPSIFFVPYRGYNSIQVKENTAVSDYNALQVDFRHTTGYGLTLQAAYTWAHNIDDSTSTYFNTYVDDNYDLSRWRATSDLNRTQVVVMNYIYELPVFKHNANAFLHNGLGGWRISGITSFFTGEPVTFTCGVTGFSTGIGTSPMCNNVGKLQIKKGTFNDPQYGPVPTWFDPGVFTQPTFSQLAANAQPGMFGYLGRNVLTGPGRNNWDLALLKEATTPWFHGEHSLLQFRWEAFNSFNHPQWKSVSAGCGGNTPFGEPCSGIANNLGNGYINGAWSPRIMQFGLKFTF